VLEHLASKTLFLLIPAQRHVLLEVLLLLLKLLGANLTSTLALPFFRQLFQLLFPLVLAKTRKTIYFSFVYLSKQFTLSSTYPLDVKKQVRGESGKDKVERKREREREDESARPKKGLHNYSEFFAYSAILLLSMVGELAVKVILLLTVLHFQSRLLVSVLLTQINFMVS
jgi:hypothetical protein